MPVDHRTSITLDVPTRPVARDACLIAAARAGNVSAFAVLMHRHEPVVRRHARSLVHGDADVCDVVQDTFIAAWRHIESFHGHAAFSTWLFAICSRRAVDLWRVQGRQSTRTLPGPSTRHSGPPDPFTVASNAAFLTALAGALAGLPPRQRSAWVLREMSGLSYPDIGRHLSMSSSAARGHHDRARAALAHRLGPWR